MRKRWGGGGGGRGGREGYGYKRTIERLSGYKVVFASLLYKPVHVKIFTIHT